MPKNLSKRTPLESAPGRTIYLHHYAADNPDKVVIMAPAMAVPHSYYADFCAWLATQGFHVIGFDYYGIGLAQEQSLRHFDSSVTEWATLDAQAVLDQCLQDFPKLPVVWFAHSIGGQLFGMLQHTEQVERMVTVATGTGYWRDMQPGLKYKSWFLWRAIVPWLLPVVGYFPGARLGIVGNVPKSAMAQWRRWCLNSDYLVGAENLYQSYAQVETPIISLAFSDDEMLTYRNIDSMHNFYKNAPQRRLRFAPEDFDLDSIGHFAIFRPRYQKLWAELLLPQLSAERPKEPANPGVE
ncbi:alpha/beta fold hydrolase [Pseudidiomarina sp. 1APR75-33.1]|uniref:alpha/beta hydrolase family protein n=1 Tax=Pseudidiomarina terrestris TaxID=2820060 RepID=UPI00264B4097|nr:alpha/beta fold hydrolase [Pseudidiomarina sp. 1APR75-33.1]MDN7126722.1 alpha/beta fold hydrolase [Pseudidiomarina sp. 1APR75-33.1]